MLFQIDPSVSALFLTKSATAQDYSGLGYLTLGAAEGSHRITGPRKVLLQLSELPAIDSRTQRTLVRAAERVAQEGHLVHRLTTIARVIAGTQANPSSSSTGAQR